MVWEVAGRKGHLARGPVVTGEWRTLEDMNAVAGWLLWSHRMASDYGGMTGREFAAAARARGVSLSETEVSRVENGETDVVISAIGKYEQMLRMPPGMLSAPLRSAARLTPKVPGARRLSTLRLAPRSIEDRQQVVDDFYQRHIADEHFTGSDWLTLIDTITQDKPSLLPNALAAQWIRMLLDECMRSVNIAYFLRVEALSTVAGCDRYATYLLDAARSLGAAPGATGVIDAWSVVGDIRRPDLINELITELPSVPDNALVFHAIALQMPAHLGTLGHAQYEAIAAELSRRVSTWSLRSYEPIAALAAALPSALGGPILRRIDTEVHPLSHLTGGRTGHDVRAEVAAYTEAALARTWPEHPTGSVLPQLIRLIVASEQFGIRHHAASLLYSSPFAAAICDEAAETCGTSRDPITRQLATYLVSRLATPDNDTQLRLLLKNDRDAGTVTNTLTAMAHAGVLTDQDDLAAYMRDPVYRQIGIYAAGIGRHPDLYSPDAVGALADWWRDKRGGVWV